MRFPTNSRSWSSILLPATEFDYRAKVGDGTGSSIIMACALWLARVFPEAVLRVEEMDEEGQTRTITHHPLEALIERPNPYYSGIVLWLATLIDFLIDGNAYWIKVRNIVDEPIQLWYTPYSLIEPKWPEHTDKNTTYISHYE